ncbi:MAG: ABC transporter substrate-binding protein [Nitrosomonas sp.]|nr:ABC transporter substrate-binding protein [Nitrosomonas sp.]
MKKTFGIFVVLVASMFVFPTWGIAGISPDKLVEETVQEVIDIIKEDEAIKSGDKEKMLDLVETKIIPHFDFTRMTRLAMGKNWRNASEEQQSVLVKEFRTLLVRTYSNTLTSYSEETISVTPIPNIGDATESTVRTQVIQGQGKQPVPIDYNMEKQASGWKVFDVTVAGVSLVTNYRSSFDSQIRRGGVDGLIKTLTSKNDSLEGH